jgi:uncharacterized protein (TIGR00299 family) protein
MRIAYIDCGGGISGDMMLGALVDVAAVQAGIDSLGLPSCRLAVRETKKCGFRALQLTVEHEPEHKHRHLHHITAMIDGSSLSPRQKELATRIFGKLAAAEAKVHGTTIEKVHFHEVGAVDSIADIVGSAIAWDLLGVERIACAAVPTGTGHVEIAHGRCSIPAPATAELLVGVPLSTFAPEGELTTPTGAALVAALVDEFGPLPAMRIERIGYGAGQKDFTHPNLLRLVVGETASGPASTTSDPPSVIALLETNLDDTTGEQIAYCAERLMFAGALDVATSPLGMKKGRPGVLLAVQARIEDADRLAAIMFRETGALGLRRSIVERLVLPRRSDAVDTAYGPVAGVIAKYPDGSERFSPEHDACQRISGELGIPLERIQNAAIAAFDARRA